MPVVNDAAGPGAAPTSRTMSRPCAADVFAASSATGMMKRQWHQFRPVSTTRGV